MTTYRSNRHQIISENVAELARAMTAIDPNGREWTAIYLPHEGGALLEQSGTGLTVMLSSTPGHYNDPDEKVVVRPYLLDHEGRMDCPAGIRRKVSLTRKARYLAPAIMQYVVRPFEAIRPEYQERHARAALYVSQREQAVRKIARVLNDQPQPTGHDHSTFIANVNDVRATLCVSGGGSVSLNIPYMTAEQAIAVMEALRQTKAAEPA